MILTLSPEQRAAIADAMRPSAVLLARIVREAFAQGNAETSGQLVIEFVPVADAALPELREVVKKYILLATQK